jgi:hypothetical protein
MIHQAYTIAKKNPQQHEAEGDLKCGECILFFIRAALAELRL